MALTRAPFQLYLRAGFWCSDSVYPRKISPVKSSRGTGPAQSAEGLPRPASHYWTVWVLHTPHGPLLQSLPFYSCFLFYYQGFGFHAKLLLVVCCNIAPLSLVIAGSVLTTGKADVHSCEEPLLKSVSFSPQLSGSILEVSPCVSPVGMCVKVEGAFQGHFAGASQVSGCIKSGIPCQQSLGKELKMKLPVS